MRSLRVDALDVRIHDDLPSMARDAADLAAAAIVDAIDRDRHANVLLATGNSQLSFIAELITRPGIDWPSVTAFHMDEYVGMSADHPASFARYMRERVATLVPIGAFHYLRGDAPDPEAEADRYGALLTAAPLHLCCLGIGENGHLAFNDPPPGGADFHDVRTVKIVTLDERCKQQQVGEGHFATFDDVPPRAITVTIPGLLAARRVLAIVPEARKAQAVRAAVEGLIAEACPASALRTVDGATLLLDRDSSALLA